MQDFKTGGYCPSCLHSKNECTCLQQQLNRITSADIEANPMLYAVLRLNTDIEVTNPFTGKREDIKVGGIAGYIPVFNTVEEAQKSSQDGKYSIVAISPACP